MSEFISSPLFQVGLSLQATDGKIGNLKYQPGTGVPSEDILFPSVSTPQIVAYRSFLVDNYWSKAEADTRYLQSFTESDPTVPSHVKGITTANIANWNAAFTFSQNYAIPNIEQVLTSGTNAGGRAIFNAGNIDGQAGTFMSLAIDGDAVATENWTNSRFLKYRDGVLPYEPFTGIAGINLNIPNWLTIGKGGYSLTETARLDVTGRKAKIVVSAPDNSSFLNFTNGGFDFGVEGDNDGFAVGNGLANGDSRLVVPGRNLYIAANRTDFVGINVPRWNSNNLATENWVLGNTPNFANTNLTFTGDRDHFLNLARLTFQNAGSFSINFSNTGTERFFLGFGTDASVDFAPGDGLQFFAGTNLFRIVSNGIYASPSFITEDASANNVLVLSSDGKISRRPYTGGGSGTETDPTVPSHVKAITTTQISNWESAFGWGNHAGLYRPISYVPLWSEIVNRPTLLSQFTNDLGNYGGFLTSETDPTVPAHVKVITSGQITNWNNIAAFVTGSNNRILHYSNTGALTTTSAFTFDGTQLTTNGLLVSSLSGTGSRLGIISPTGLLTRGAVDPAAILLSSTNYADPSWLTSLNWSKITNVPVFSNGWSPVFSLVVDGQRRVLQIFDWIGGQGVKPATGDYIGTTGFTSVLANAVDVRGTQGSTGPAGVAGPQGVQGPTGPQGVAGPQGLAGADMINAAFSSVLTFNENKNMTHTVAGAINFTLAANGHTVARRHIVFLTANGVNKPTFGAGFTVVRDDYMNTDGVLNRLFFEYLPTGSVMVEMIYV